MCNIKIGIKVVAFLPNQLLFNFDNGSKALQDCILLSKNFKETFAKYQVYLK